MFLNKCKKINGLFVKKREKSMKKPVLTVREFKILIGKNGYSAAEISREMGKNQFYIASYINSKNEIPNKVTDFLISFLGVDRFNSDLLSIREDLFKQKITRLDDAQKEFISLKLGLISKLEKCENYPEIKSILDETLKGWNENDSQ